MENDLAKMLKYIAVIYREERQNLKHGEISDYYVDVKKAYGYPAILSRIADDLWGIMDKRTTCIAAAGYGGLPPAALISSRYGPKLCLVRDAPKQHGKGGMMDGYIPCESDGVSFVDDVLTSGGSFRSMMAAVAPTKAKILGCHAVVKRKIGADGLGVPFSYLLDAETLMS